MACLVFCAACSSQRQFVKTELYFGLCKNETCANDTDFIPESEWQDFVDNVITPRFRKGLTIIDAKGQWTDSQTGKMIRERSKILVLLHEDGKSEEESIEYIRESYIKSFKQDSVMRVRSDADVSF